MLPGARIFVGPALAMLLVGHALAAPQRILPAPYEMVRSLRNLQDKIAAGKVEALPLLRILLVRIARQFGEVDPKKWNEVRNQEAAMTYLLNGGDPDVVRAVLSKAKRTPEIERLLEGALAYANGDTKVVVQAFAGLKQGDLPFDLLDSIYLVSATPLAEVDPLEAMGRLDYVRLTAPGSLLEEAAIRRSLPLAGKLGDAAKLRLIARNYLRRFGGSPYLEDFLNQLVIGLVELNGQITNAQIAKIAAFAPDRVRLSLYLRLARGELLHGQPARAEFAARHAETLAKTFGADTVQAQLYAAASGVATTNVQSAEKALSSIPRHDLHPADARLLVAAEMLAREITRPPARPKVAARAGRLPRMLLPANLPAIEDTPRRQTDLEAFNATVSKAQAALSQVNQLLGTHGK